jgi:sugar-specific transcriptional regulator TrmB
MTIQNLNLTTELSSLGLSLHSAAVYIYLLERTSAIGSSKIASGTGLHRTYIYKALEDLLSLKLIETIGRGKWSNYKALPPSKLLKIQEEKEKTTRDIVEKLQRISKLSYEQEAKLIIGREAIIKYQKEYVENAKQGSVQYLIGGSGQSMKNLYAEDLENNIEHQSRKKFKTLYICPASEEKLFSDYGKIGVNLKIKTMNIIPEMFPTIAIRDNTVEIHSYFNSPTLYIVESKEVAEKFKIFFMGLWNI